MLASIFIIQGYDTLRDPARVAAAPPNRWCGQLSERVPAMLAEAEQAVRINGAIQLAAGALLALGRAAAAVRARDRRDSRAHDDGRAPVLGGRRRGNG